MLYAMPAAKSLSASDTTDATLVAEAVRGEAGREGMPGMGGMCRALRMQSGVIGVLGAGALPPSRAEGLPPPPLLRLLAPLDVTRDEEGRGAETGARDEGPPDATEDALELLMVRCDECGAN